MTKINRITLHGFKSFAHKTEIPLEQKFNCILGPNGSGKSNIGDALCFVLGKISAKSMRAEKAANLIFNGGKKSKPSANASVEISFCNKNKKFPVEDKEVIVNRTITNKGASKYSINGKRHTRSDVVELLSSAKINPDGYNVILQGDITRFVDQSPLERRKIIEEISDVSVYEERKHKANLELNKVETKLNDATIILKERKVHLRELKKDRDQALKFKELKDKIDSNKATYLHYQIKDNETIKQKYDQEVTKFQDKIDSSETKIVKLKEEIEGRRKNVTEINTEIEQKGEKEQLKVHREIEELKVALAKDKTRISTLKDEINKIRLRKDQFNEEMKELESKSSSSLQQRKELEKQLQLKKKELINLDNSILQFKKKNKIESSGEIEDEIEEKDKFIDEKQEEVQKARIKQQDLFREKDKIEYQLETLDEKIKKVKEVEKENKGQVKELQNKKNMFKSATLKLNQCLDQDSSFASQLANARKNMVEAQERHAKLNAKTLSLQAGLSSNKAIASILENKKQFKGVHGTISELGQVKKMFAPALEAAAGGRMQNIVVDNDSIAADCIKYLKSNKLGSASFIPLNKIRYNDITTENKKLLNLHGVHDFALNLINFKSQYQKAFSYVFGNTLIVEDIDIARKVGIGKIKMSTLDGGIAESSGVMRGGFNVRRSSLGFKEKDSMEALERVESDIAELQGIIANVGIKREANEQEISSLRNHKSEFEAEIIKLEKTLHLDNNDLDVSGDLKIELNKRLDEVDDELSVLQKEINLVNQDLAKLKSKKQILRSEVNQLRNPRLLAQLSAFEESKQTCKEDIVKIESEQRNVSLQVDQMFTPEREKILDILKQHEKEMVQFTGEIKELGDQIKHNETDLTEKEKASKEFYAKYHQLFNKREKLGQEINKFENEIENSREKCRTNEREVNMVSLKNAEIKAKLAALSEEFEKYKDVEIFEKKPIEELKQEINKFEVMLAQMSAVNMKALEIYEEVETEYNKLMEKKDSLDTEKTDVLTLMNEIETKKKDHFMKTFDSANENFQRIFSSLFKKGKAYLQLDNPNSPFEEGLSIKVKITGKRFMDLKSLSGGEKTLTALSFIFAIQEYQPATFYILDEIDAALDKHNSETLSKLIRSYSDKAQYILISHNDSIISEADTLFGVSMNEGNISKVTSLKI
jgi:chromosome segregation protein